MHNNHDNTFTECSATTKLSHALQMARYGFRVHPCVPGTKKPKLVGWKQLATTNEATIRAWWKECPDANIGVVLGHDIIALDIDRHPGKPDGVAALATLEQTHGQLPITWASYSAAAEHGVTRYFRLPPGVSPPRRQKLAPGIDVLAHGDNLIAPGSRHPRGTTYVWDEFCNPGTMPIATAPDWLVILIRSPKNNPQNLILCNNQASIPPPHRNTCLIWTEPPYTGDQIRELFADEAVVRQCLSACGIAPDVVIARSFRCPLHGPDHHPSAAILPPTKEHPTYLFSCHHGHQSAPRGVSLPELYYLTVTGHRAGTLPKSSFLVWAVRLLVKAGVLQPPPLHAPKLWPGAPAEAETVYGGFVELLQVRSLLTGRHAPFAWKFALQWLGHALTEHALSKAMRWLLSKGYLLKAGVESGLQLFRLGGYLFRKRLRAAPVPSTQAAVLEAVAPAVAAYGGAPAPLRRTGQGEAEEEHGTDCPCTECELTRVTQKHLDELRQRNGYVPGFGMPVGVAP